MTQNLKIEVLTGDISIDGMVVTNLVTKEELSTAIVKKADLGTDGKIPTSQLPDEIVNTAGIVDVVKLQLETSIKDAVDESNAYAESYTDNALSSKADLASGKVPLEQLPTIDQYPQFGTALSNLSTSILTSVKQRTDELEKTKADLGEDGKVLREQIPSYEKISGLPEQLEVMSTQTAAVSGQLDQHKLQTADQIDDLSNEVDAARKDFDEKLLTRQVRLALGESRIAEPSPSWPDIMEVIDVINKTPEPVFNTILTSILSRINSLKEFDGLVKPYYENFPTYIQYDPNITDYSDIIRNALLGGRDILFSAGKVYPITSKISATITRGINIDGNGSTILYTGEAALDRMFEISHSIALDHNIIRLKLDGNMKSSTTMRIHSTVLNSVGESNFYSNQLSIVNCRKSLSSQPGDGFHLRGSFRSSIFENVFVENICMASGVGKPGVAGVAGIVITHMTDTCFPTFMELRNPIIRKVWSEDPDYTMDQDGIKFFSGNDSKTSKKNGSKLTVYGGEFKNCWGRSIKTQCRYTLVIGTHFKRNEGNSTDSGNGEVNIQTGNGLVSGATFHYENGCTGGVCVSFDNGAGYDNVGGSVKDCEVYLDASTILKTFVSNYPRDGSNQTIIATGNKIFGKAYRFSASLVNGDKNTFIYNDNQIDEIVAFDHGNGVLVKTFNISKASGAITPRGGYAEITGNTVLNSQNDVNLSIDGIAGVSVNLTISARNNSGMLHEVRGNHTSSGTKNRQVFKANAFGVMGQTTSITMQNRLIPAGEEYEYSTEGFEGGMIFVGMSGAGYSHAILSVVGSHISLLQSHNVIDYATGAVTQRYVNVSNGRPSTPVGSMLDIWRHPDYGGKIVVRNNSGAGRNFNIFQIVM